MGHSANIFIRNHHQFVSLVQKKPTYWELWSFDRLHRFSEKNTGISNSRVSFIRWWQRAAWRLSPWQRFHGQRRDASTSTSTSTSAPLLVKGDRCSEREGLEKGRCWRPEACHGGRSILAAVLRFICRWSSLEFFSEHPTSRSVASVFFLIRNGQWMFPLQHLAGRLPLRQRCRQVQEVGERAGEDQGGFVEWDQVASSCELLELMYTVVTYWR